MKKLPSPTSAPTDPTETLAAIGPVARSSVVDAVADRLRNEILAGRIVAGSKLPSERELSLALGVNRLTLRAALARLEAMGLVSTRHGSGTEVVSWRERAGLEALPMVLSSLHRQEPAFSELLGSLLEVRRVLVSESVALAAERHTEEDLVLMKQVAADQKNRLDDPLAFAHGDLALQRVIVRAARNVGLELLLNTFSRFPEEQPELVAELYDRREEALPFYDVLVELVRAGDGEAARRALRTSFEMLDADWLTRHGHGVAVQKTKTKKTKR
jgi:GntR family transcriptional repressor for pyruvate dehydrogenase complex